MNNAADWENFHDGLCPVFIGDGACACHVAWIKSQIAEVEQLKLQVREMKKCDCMTVLDQTKDAMETSGMNLEAKGVGEAMAALRGHHALKSLTEKREGRS